MALKRPPEFTDIQVRNVLILLSKKSGGVVMEPEDRLLFRNIVYELQRGHLDVFSIINYWLKQKDLKPALELLWALEEENVFKVTTFLYFHQEYSCTLCEIFSEALSLEIEEQNVITILTNILNIILSVKNCSDFQSISEEIINNLISRAVEKFESGCYFKWNYFQHLKNLKNVGKDYLNDFALLHILKFLTYDPSSFDLFFVLGNHIKLWTTGKLPGKLISFFEEVLSSVPPQTVLGELNTLVEEEVFNWKFLLSIISVFIAKKENSEILKIAVDSWLRNAIDGKNKTLFYTSLIIARHCCAEKARFFSNYPTWFGSLSLKTIPYFTFFFESISYIVPHEPPLFLKIHINKVPTAPTSCQYLLIDYIALAKTRLSDLNETTDYIGLFNDYHDTDEEGQESDVQRAISIYNENQEIPKPLLEASVFRRQYYEKVFLKRLLSVPQSSDEERSELIKKLHSVGKIPQIIYNKWYKT